MVGTLLATLVAVLNPVVAEAAGTVLFNQPFHNNTRTDSVRSSCRPYPRRPPPRTSPA
ncbi:hypothetical protein ACLQ29_10815 [Micromonospora sp. DT228]|uniref:hypothetical protein n=1 Tax=Micromonospora sp. DT228 TaxID=3393443 RepID=UPI003CE755A0